MLKDRIEEIDLEKAKLHKEINELRTEQMKILKDLEK